MSSFGQQPAFPQQFIAFGLRRTLGSRRSNISLGNRLKDSRWFPIFGLGCVFVRLFRHVVLIASF